MRAHANKLSILFCKRNEKLNFGARALLGLAVYQHTSKQILLSETMMWMLMYLIDGEIVGRDYFCSMNNIHELKNQFNSFLHECV
jgi:hypothetical protein